MNPSPTFADTIVIGGGTAGAAVAGRLAERADQAVLLIEAGPDYGALSAGQWPAELTAGRVVAESHDWGYRNAGNTGQPNHALQRARVLGGCSAHNGCVALWGSRADYDGWAALGNPGWRTDEVLPYFQQANAKLRVRRFAEQEITPFHAASVAALANLGVPLVDDLNQLDSDVGVGTAPVNMAGTVRWNSAFAYLDPVRANGHLTVLDNTQVNKVLFHHGRAIGVEVSGVNGVTTLAAGRVILCAGAYGSPAILLRSGIGPADELRSLHIQPVLDRPGVGHNLHDHPALNLFFVGSEQMNRAMDSFAGSGRTIFTEQSLAKLRSEQCQEAFDLHLYPCSSPGPNADGQWEVILPIANLTPHSRGVLRLRDANPATAPHIDTGYLTDAGDIDLAVLCSGLRLLHQLIRQSPLAELLGAPITPALDARDLAAVRRACLHYYHPVGSCKMALATDPLAVVDARGKVHGAEQLYVADASIMPVVPRANTNLPALMVAERIVGWL